MADKAILGGSRRGVNAGRGLLRAMGVGEELKGVEGIGGVGDEINLYKSLGRFAPKMRRDDR